MILDLDAEQGVPVEREADDLVIGAGIAGCLVATRLAQRGRSVMMVESGGEKQIRDTHPFNAVVQDGQVYAGAEHGRFRCLGGTSSRWGGAMIPFMEEDVGDHPCGWLNSWGIPYQQLISHLPEVERMFRLPPGPYEELDFIEASNMPAGGYGLVARAAKWPPFGLRNVAVALGSELRARAGPEVWLHAHAVAFDMYEGGALCAVTVKSPTGHTMRIRAGNIVVAAGAIESTRLLLAMDNERGNKIFEPDDMLGRYFNDHISAPIAVVTPSDRSYFNRKFGIRFELGGMRNVRFELSGAMRKRRCVPSSFAHVVYEPPSADDGLAALRGIYRTIQSRQLPAFRDVGRVAADFPWFLRAAWWRYMEQRLLYPGRGAFRLHLVTEQKPQAKNAITLSEGERDDFGVPKAVIRWRVGMEDIDYFERLADTYLQLWRNCGLEDVATLQPLPAEEKEDGLGQMSDIYHPAGTIRIGRSPATGVVDSDLRAHRVSNLFVVSTAVFPSAGGANPTLMMMLYALDLGARLT